MYLCSPPYGGEASYRLHQPDFIGSTTYLNLKFARLYHLLHACIIESKLLDGQLQTDTLCFTSFNQHLLKGFELLNYLCISVRLLSVYQNRHTPVPTN